MPPLFDFSDAELAIDPQLQDKVWNIWEKVRATIYYSLTMS